MQTHPIGIFDSGVGGTSIFTEIHKLLPHEHVIYLADSKNAPYGEKTSNEILELSLKNTRYLVNQRCKLIVVACNTATTNAISQLRERFNLPFIGIEPAIKPAAIQSKTKVIGILATKGTLSSHLFHKTTDLFAEGIKVIEREGNGIVPLIENGQLYSETMTSLLRSYLQPMIDQNMDALVLGCTHYAYLKPILNHILPANIKIIDSGEAVARQTKNILAQHHLLNHSEITPTIEFLSNGNTAVLKDLLKHQFTVRYQDF